MPSCTGTEATLHHPTCRASLSSSGPISSPSTCTRFSLSGRFSLCLKKVFGRAMLAMRSGIVPAGSADKDAHNAELVLLQ